MIRPKMEVHARQIAARLRHALPQVTWCLEGERVSGDLPEGTMAFVVLDDDGRVELRVELRFHIVLPDNGADGVAFYIKNAQLVARLAKQASMDVTEFDA